MNAGHCFYKRIRDLPDSFAAAGEILEFKSELHSSDKSKRKDAVKKVIAAMTVGKDVSMLFPDVVNCMQVDSVTCVLTSCAGLAHDRHAMGPSCFSLLLRC